MLLRNIFKAALITGSVSKLSRTVLRQPARIITQSHRCPNKIPYRSLFMGGLFAATAVGRDQQDKEFVKSYENLSFFHKNVFKDLGFSPQQSGAIIHFYQLLYYAHGDIDFNFDIGSDINERHQALEHLKSYFSPKNFRKSFTIKITAFDNDDELIQYHEIPSNTPLKDRHLQLFKIATTLQVKITDDMLTGDTGYNKTVLEIARKVHTSIEQKYPKLRAYYNTEKAVKADAIEASKERDLHYSRPRASSN